MSWSGGPCRGQVGRPWQAFEASSCCGSTGSACRHGPSVCSGSGTGSRTTDKGRGAHVAQSSSTDNSTDNFIPSIEQLADITDPEHWDAEDLKELVDRYGCVAGFPDGTFKGEQPATRFEVATLIKACLDLGISIHEENHTQHTNNTPVPSELTPHPHEPTEHEHDTVAEHEHLIDPSGHTHEDIVPHPHKPAEHEHPINPYILISIIVFIIYQLFVFMKIRELGHL
ncbi:MAG: S-layer homology domain-containing protein [Cyanobacteria bacterium MAG IRC3_bin_20]|nr:S-layer homology domain-containing protein [Cyanobacteria bacterium MAG IRC3_bin_20]